MRHATRLEKNGRFGIGCLVLAFVVGFCLLETAKRCAAIQVFYEPGDLAAAREIDAPAVAWINKANKELGLKTPALFAEAMMNGPNHFSITVIDDKTMRPVAEYVVHGVVIGHQIERRPRKYIHPEMGQRLDPYWKTTPGKYRDEEKILGLGRLESQQVKDAGGTCRYEGLGRLEAEFQVWAKGYVPQGLTVRIPEGGTSALVRLTASGTIRGKILDIDGTPLRQAGLKLTYKGLNRDLHTGYEYETTTGADGRFQVVGLPPDIYSLSFPDVPRNVREIEDKVDDRLRADERRAPAGTLPPKLRARRRAELLGRPCPLIPHVEGVELKAGSDVDVGTVRLERAPILELQVVGEDGAPLDNLPFVVLYPGDMGYDYQEQARTDDAGQARMSLAGWRPGADAVVLPSGARDKGEGYQFKRRKTKPWHDPYLDKSDKEIYEQAQSSWSIHDDDAEDVEKLPPRYEALRAEQKAEFHAEYEKERQKKRESAARAAALPDHPDYELFTPRPGEVSKVRLVFHPTDAAMNPHLVFRDGSTGQPIAEFRGAISFGRNDERLLIDFDSGLERLPETSRPFRSRDRSGRVTLAGLTVPGIILDNTPHDPASRNVEVRTDILVDAPGYARQAFTVTTTQMRADQELAFDLEPEARVTGRVLIGETNEPLTKATLKALLVRNRKWNDQLEQIWPNREAPRILMENGSVNNGRGSGGGDRHSASMAFGRLGPDGRFEIRGLCPGDQWNLRLMIAEIPQYTQTDLTLKPGLNDLGDIKVGGEGCLVLKVSDERGQPLPGVYLKWPLGMDSNSGWPMAKGNENPVTDANGVLIFSLRPLQGDRQILRLAPPWGFAVLNQDRERQWPRIMYDAVLDLNRNAVKTIQTKVERGHTLRVELARTPARDALVRSLQGEVRTPWSRQPQSTYLAIRTIFIQSLEPNPEGFVYQQMDGGSWSLPFTSSTMVMPVQNVPPGRYALCLVGCSFAHSTSPDARAYPDAEDGVGRPLAYTEMEMLPTTTTVKLEINPVDVEIALDKPPLQPQAKPLETMVFMDRTEPLSTFFGGDNRRVFASRWLPFGKPPEAIITPMVGTSDGFSTVENPRKAVYRPVVFHAVPQGTYHVEVYATMEDIGARPPRPYFEKEIKVERNGPGIRLTVPCQGKEANAPPAQ